MKVYNLTVVSKCNSVQRSNSWWWTTVLVYQLQLHSCIQIIPFKVYCNIVAVPLEYVYSLSTRI